MMKMRPELQAGCLRSRVYFHTELQAGMPALPGLFSYQNLEFSSFGRLGQTDLKLSVESDLNVAMPIHTGFSQYAKNSKAFSQMLTKPPKYDIIRAS
jgi:hypothetical protein